jgi:hypothetical protein
MSKKYKINAYKIVRLLDEDNLDLCWVKVFLMKIEVSIVLSTHINFIKYKNITFGFDRLIWDENTKSYSGVMEQTFKNDHLAQEVITTLADWTLVKEITGELASDRITYEKLQLGII